MKSFNLLRDYSFLYLKDTNKNDYFISLSKNEINVYRKSNLYKLLKKRNVNYNLKAKVLSDNYILKEYISVSKKIYLYCSNKDSGISFEEYIRCNDILYNLRCEFGEQYVKECDRIWNSQRKRVSRLRKRITYMLDNSCLFLTLTFTNEVLNSTTVETRRTYIRKFLKQFDTLYIANIDFGDLHEREHYHALLMIDKINFSLYPYGRINGLRVRNRVTFNEDGIVCNESAERISKYISKLTNHAIKSSTKNNRIIYSRDFNSLC